MGSFNIRCGVSGMNIQWGEPIYFCLLEKNKFSSSDFMVNSYYNPTTLMQEATYYDYGKLHEGTKLSEVNSLFSSENKFAFDIESDNKNDSLYFPVHKSVYEKFSSRQLGDISQYDKISENEIMSAMEDLHKKCDAVVFEDKAFPKEAFELQEEFKEIFSDGVNRNGHFFHILFNKFIKEKNADFLGPSLASEFYKKRVFEWNMYEMNKKYNPAQYTNQMNNNGIYVELAKSIIVVSEDKEMKWHSENID